MIKRLILLSTLCLPLVLGCNPKEKIAKTPCDFEIRVDDIAGTRAVATINPSDENACYYWTILYGVEDAYTYSSSELVKYVIDGLDKLYDGLYASDSENLASFKDVFCYKGSRTFPLDFLLADSRHRLVVVQMDPDTRQPIGLAHTCEFNTRDVPFQDIDFNITFRGDVLTIVPSDPDRTYYWDYENSQVIRDLYTRMGMYFYSLVYLYQDYGFMDHLTDKGTCQWVFSEEDHSLVEGEQCTLVLAGYDGKDINSDLTMVEFVYYKEGVRMIGTPEKFEVYWNNFSAYRGQRPLPGLRGRRL